MFVGCIGFDFPAGEFAPGIIAVVTPDGVARTAAEDLAFPNAGFRSGNSAPVS